MECNYLCRATGETGLAVARIVADRAGVQQFIIDEWLGPDNGEEIESAMREFDGNDFDACPLMWWGLETGKVMVEAVCPVAQPAELEGRK